MYVSYYASNPIGRQTSKPAIPSPRVRRSPCKWHPAHGAPLRGRFSGLRPPLAHRAGESLPKSRGHSSSSSFGSISFAANACSALSRETIFFPVCASISRRVLPAMRPPCAATIRLAANVRGRRSLEISVVVASASMFSTNSKFVMLSRRLSVFNPLYRLYCPSYSTSPA